MGIVRILTVAFVEGLRMDVSPVYVESLFVTALTSARAAGKLQDFLEAKYELGRATAFAGLLPEPARAVLVGQVIGVEDSLHGLFAEAGEAYAVHLDRLP